ncbi:hypothetical protein ACHHYP_07064 [Achlya hypogyna]|uniref:Reverse transcriptase domain-containing protein n=1 Tax=Achlya hypogyna TaxID=1202772 RepID=A0A1V9YR67_ACHHY|nr:hypothetical protein ACHHYP_07064 [Achlya hypogyna]
MTTGQSLNIGSGILVGIPKPNKPQGSTSSLRPIVLLNSIRKSTPSLFSTASLRRSSPCRYKQVRNIIRSDISEAFDSIDRVKLLQVLEEFLDEDGVRLVQMLLFETTLTIRPNDHLGREFQNNVGTPRGDALSPVLFIVYIETALRYLVTAAGMPRRLLRATVTYTDDVDFIFKPTSCAPQDSAPSVLSQWSLYVNEKRTEETLLEGCIAPDSTLDWFLLPRELKLMM